MSNILTDEQIVQLILAVITTIFGVVAGYVAPAAKGYLGARGTKIANDILKEVIERAIDFAMADVTESTLGSHMPTPERLQRVEKAVAYIETTRPDLVRKAKASADALRLRLQADVARRVKTGRATQN